MLALDDPAWSALDHAYGAASDIPDLLRALERSPGPTRDYRDEPWCTLWSALCHQDDVYSASYAAVPHLVRIARETPSSIDFSFFQLPASVEIARCNHRGPPIPTALEAAYMGAIDGLIDCVNVHRGEPWDQDMLLAAMMAQAVSKGHIRTAEAIGNLDNSLIDKLISLELLE